MVAKGLFKKGVNLLVILSFLSWNQAIAAPEGGSVVQGSAEISQTQNQTVINQSSQNAVINWNSFNTASHEAVQFNQPNASSVALNRVTNGLPTQFAGSLNANGQVWILNPAGVLFTNTAKVDVAGLVATTHGILDSNFMAGHYKFDLVPGSESASIINNGLISAKDSGIVALVAPHVSNNGLIQVNLGKVHLASGAAFTLDMYGDQLINFGSNAPIQNGSVSNTGKIIADGGKVYMTANYAANVLDNMISMSGSIEAKSVGVNKNGEVVLYGADYQTKNLAGTTKVSGKISAPKGFVETSGHVLIIEPGSEIETGNWLLDPADLTISTGANSNVTLSSPFQPTAAVSVLNVTTLQTALGSGNVLVQTSNDGFAGSGNITVANAVTWASGNSLTLSAFNNIIVNAALNGGATAAVNLNAGGSITGAGVITANTLTTNSVTGLSLTGLNATANFNATNTTSGNVAFTHTGALNITGITQNVGNLTITNTGAITQSGPISVSGTSGFTAGAGAITLTDPLNNFTGNVTFSNSGANAVSIFNNAPLALGAFTVGNTFTASTSGGNITLNGNITSGTSQTYNQPVIVNANLTLTSTSGNINFASTVDDSALRTHSLTLVGASAPIFPFATAVGGVTPLNILAITYPSLTVDAALAGVTSDQLNKGTDVTLTASSGNLTLSSPITQTLNPVATTLTLVSAANFNLGSTITLTGTTALSFSAPSFNIDATFAPFIATELNNGTPVTVTATAAGGISITSPITVSTGTAALSFFANAAGALLDIAADVDTGGTQFYQAAGTGGAITLEPGVTIQGGGAITLSNFIFSGTGVSTAMNIFGQIGTTAKRQAIILTLGGNGFNSSLNLMPGATIVATNFSATALGPVITLPGINWNISGTLSALADNVASTGQVHVTGNLGTALLPVNAISLRGGLAVPGAGLGNSAVVVDPGVSIYVATNLTFVSLRIVSNIIIDNQTDFHVPGTLTLNTSGASGALGKVIITSTGVLGNPLVPSQINAISIVGAQSYPGTGFQVDPGAHIYGNSLTINGRGGNISLDNGTINAYHISGTINIINAFGGTSAQINGVIGAPGDLVGALVITAPLGITLNAPGTGIMTSGSQTYTGVVKLNSNQTLTNTSGNITFSSTLDNCPGSMVACTGGAGPFGLTTNSTSGSTVFSGIVGGVAPISFIDITGAASINTTAITTTGLQIYRGATTLTASPTLTSQTAGITFNSTLNGAFGLTTSVVNGQSVTFNGAVGGTTALTSLTTSATGTTHINGGSVRTSTFQNYLNSVVLGATTTLSSTGGGALNFATIDSDGTPRALTLTTSALTTLGNNIGINSLLDALTVTNSVAIGGNIHTVNNQLYSGAATLIANPATPALTTLTSDSGNITFNSTLNGGFNLNVNTSLEITFNSDVGGITPLTSLSVTATNNGQINLNGLLIKTTGAQTYSGIVFMNNPSSPVNVNLWSTLGSTISFDNSVSPTLPHIVNLTITGNLMFSAPGGTMEAGSTQFNNLHVTGSTTVNSGNFNTQLNQDFDGPVTLNVASIFFGTRNLGGTITFGSTLDGSANVTIFLGTNSSTTNTLTINGAIGGVTPLTSLLVNGRGTSQSVANINTSTIHTTGSQEYRNVGSLLNTDVTMTSNASGISFTSGSTVDSGTPVVANARALTLTAPLVTTLSGNIGSINPLKSLTITNASNISTPNITTTTSQTYWGPVTLNSPTVTLTSGITPTITGTITFNSTIDATTSGANSLVVNANNGSALSNVFFNNSVGGTTPLNSVTVTSANITLANNVSVHTTGVGADPIGSQVYNGTLTSPGTVTLTSDSENISFSNANGAAFNLIANAPNGAVILTSGGTISINTLNITGLTYLPQGGFIDTTGASVYNGSILLNTLSPFDQVWFGGSTTVTVHGSVYTQLGASAVVTLNQSSPTFFIDGNMGDVTTLVVKGVNIQTEHMYSLVAFGTLVFNGNFIRSQGIQRYMQPVTFTAPTVNLINDNNGVIYGVGINFFNTPVSGVNTDLITQGDTYFGRVVGSGITPITVTLKSFTNTAFLTDIVGGSSITTTNGQTYGGQVILDNIGNNNPVTLSGSTITFNNAVLQRPAVTPVGLIITGNMVANAPIGPSNISGGYFAGQNGTLLSLTVNGQSNLNGGLVNTTNNQLYNGAVLLGATNLLNSTSGNITFNSTIDNTFDLTATANQVRFKGDVGATTPVGAFSVNANIINFDGAITQVTSSGIQTYTGTGINPLMTIGVDPVFTAPSFVIAIPVAILADTTYTSTAGNIDFQSTIDGPANLILNPFGTAIFQGDVGATTALASLTVNGLLSVSGATVINTDNYQIYNDLVTLNNNLAITAGTSGCLTTNCVQFTLGTIGVDGITGPAFNLDIRTFDASKGPSGAGIAGTVNVNGFTMGGTGGGDISPLVPHYSTVGGSSGTGAWDNTFIVLGATGLYCVNGNCTGTLTITATDDNKIYGSPFTPTLYSVIGLSGGDSISSVTLTSPVGSLLTASVLGGPYSIIPSNATSQGITNNHYTSINYVNGSLTVNPAALSITPDPIIKTYGTTTPSTTSAFTPVGLQNGETVGQITLISTGLAPTASVLGGPYSVVGSAATGGTFDPNNYTISYPAGTITVNPAVLTITSLPQTKTEGDFLPLTTTAFIPTGLQNGETVGTVDADSLGLSPSATAGTYPYISVSNAAGGTFDPTNYIINYVIGGDVTVLGGAPINNFNLPPIQIFEIPDGFNPCGMFGCGPTDIILIDPLGGFGIGGIFDITIYPEGYLGVPPQGTPIGVVISELGDTQAIGEFGTRELGIGTPVFKADELVAPGASCVCIKTVEKDKKCYSNTEVHPEWTHECRVQNIELKNNVYIKNATVAKKHTLKDLMARLSLSRP